MFQLAYGQKLAKKYRQNIQMIDLTRFASEPRKWGLDFFGFLPDVSNKYRFLFLESLLQAAKKVLGTKNLFKLGIHLEGSENLKEQSWVRPWYVSGYWQNLLCIDGCDLKIFSRGKNQIGPIIQEASPTVAFHIRRGDFAYKNSIHDVCDSSWYKSAYLAMQERFKNPIFKVFTDDPTWVLNLGIFNEDQIMGNAPIVHPAIDLLQMSQCNHFIISNSTYSWWAAMLSGDPQQIVIAPQFWFKNIPTSSLNICPHNWILL
ncbi:alpha-1,2-fucosyltransferase [Polynucleobacter paneuropaeus]|jgi:hypothetical protein|nr:alpha-1,2-fucosyltransferase [Polynucleobacter paneuropaeus]